MIYKIQSKNPLENIETNINNINVSKIGIVLSSNYNSEKDKIYSAFKNFPEVNKVILLDCEKIENDKQMLSHNILMLSQKCEVIIFLDPIDISTNILNAISRNCKTILFVDFLNVSERKKKQIEMFSNYVDYRFFTNYEFSQNICKKTSLDAYFISTNPNITQFYPESLTKKYDLCLFEKLDNETLLKEFNNLNLNVCFIGENDSNDEIRTKINSSKIIIDFNSTEIYSDLFLTSFFCKSFLLSNYYNKDDEISSEKHYVYFSNEQSLINLIEYYLFYEKKRNEISSSGFNYITKNKTWENISKKILEILLTNKGMKKKITENFIIQSSVRKNIPQSNIPNINNNFKETKHVYHESFTNNLLSETEFHSSISISSNKKILFVIPFMYEEKRFELFKKCLASLPNPQTSKNVEIGIHEIGRQRMLNPEFLVDYQYHFSKFDGVFNRAWSINSGIKLFSKEETKKIVFIDSDLIVTNEWLNEVLEKDGLYVAWGKIYYLTEEETNHYFQTGQILEKNGRTKQPSIRGAAGGATLIDKQDFYKIRGIPESVHGWGAEDNLFMHKAREFGYPFLKFNSKIYHLYHSHRTQIDKESINSHKHMFDWNLQNWKEYNEKIEDNWGIIKNHKEIIRTKNVLNSLNIFNPETINKVLNNPEPMLTLSCFSWGRPEVLIRSLQGYLDTFIIPVNLFLRVQGNEKLTDNQRNRIRQVASQFHDYRLVYSEGNLGSGPPRKECAEQSLKTWSTKYISLIDDDLQFQKGSIESEICFLEENPEFGAINLLVSPCSQYKIFSKKNGRTILKSKELVRPVDVNIDCFGSATSMVRREAFNTSSLNPNHFVGYQDFSFFLSLRKNGWKIAALSFPQLVVLNRGGGGSTYSSERTNREKINASREEFRRTWGNIL
jgi:hypothetical protein